MYRQRRDNADGTRSAPRWIASPYPGLFVRYTVGEALGASKPDSLEFFFLERYLLFAEKAGALHIGRVHHPPYPAHRATVLEVEESLFAAVGLPPASGAPALAHYAPGVDVEVFGPWPLR